MKKNKIAFVVAIPGSANVFLKNHFLELTKDYNVTLFANFPDEKSKGSFVNIGVSCHCIPIGRKINIATDIKTLTTLYWIFRREKFDSVHSVTPKAGLITAIASWLAGVKIRIHIFTGQVWATKYGLSRLLLKSLDKVIATLDTHILVDGESQRRFLISEGVVSETKSKVLANGSICGVNLDNFNISEKTCLSERAKFDFSENDVVYIFLGRLNHDKGIGELLEAFDRLAETSPNAKLLLYGDNEGDYDTKADEYKHIIRNTNYFYPGGTDAPYKALQCGDVFVLPTWREGFGSSVIEAQALGLPVITSDAYGVVDASVPNETGLRCKVNDPEGLYECMKIYYDDPDMRALHGRAGRKRVESLFDSNIVTSAWMEYYKELFVVMDKY